jgi:uncharacterized protein YegL
MGKTVVWNGEFNNANVSENNVVRNTAVLGTEERRSTANTANVAIIDCSSSMQDRSGNSNQKKIDAVKEAVTTFVANLPATAHLSIVSFGSSATLLRAMAPIGNDKLKIIQLVQNCKANGTTAMKEGLTLAEKQFRNTPAGFLKRGYLQTDGIPDDDPTAKAETLKKQNVQLHTIGFGTQDHIDENLLKKMASLSESGSPLYYHFMDASNLTLFLKKQTQTISQ